LTRREGSDNRHGDGAVVAPETQQEPIMKFHGDLKADKLATLPLSPEGKATTHSDGRGLVVVVEPGKAGPTRTYNYRFTFNGKGAILRMGRIDEMNINEARRRVMGYRQMVLDGKDPRQQAAIAAAAGMTFKQYADEAIPHLAGETPDAIWSFAVRTVADLHKLPIATITRNQVYEAIAPYWREHPVQASRCVPKLCKIFNRARLNGLRVDNPCLLEDLYGLGLKPPRSMKPVEAHAALSVDELPAFLQRLAYQPDISARCLEYAILTGARSQEARQARWTWLNADMTTVTIPAEFMKAGRVHTVPLATQVTELLRRMPRNHDLIFPSHYSYEGTKAMRAPALVDVANKAHVGDKPITVHGFRSTFRVFAGTPKLEERMVLELCIAHETRTPTELAYDREPDGSPNLYLERRRPVMQAWADYATGVVPAANVVPFRREVA